MRLLAPTCKDSMRQPSNDFANMRDIERAPGSSTPTAAARDWVTPVELVLLGAIWGASFLFMRIAAPAFGPIPLVEVRLALGALVLSPLLWRARAQIAPSMWWRLAGIGAINSALPFTLFAWAAERAPAGIGAITNSMTVLFTALVAFVGFGERIGTRRVIGLLAGFVGVVVLASGRTAGEGVMLAAIAGTLAALCYGIAAVLIRRYLVGLPPVAVASATLVCAALLVSPLAIATWPSAVPRALDWACVLLLGALCTGLAYAFYFRLIRRIGPARAVTVTYLIPLFGVIWAWLALGEPLTVTMAIAGALILGGVALSQGAQVAKPAPAPAAAVAAERR